MANILRIKRRVSGQAGAPSSLANAELAYSEVDDILYYGKGDNSGIATSVIPIAGTGQFLSLTGNATISGNLTFSGNHVITGTVSGSGIQTYVTSFRLDQFAAPNTNVSMGNNRLTGLADPVSATDAANKQYVDSARSGLDVKLSCRAASVNNLGLSGLGTIDGVSLSSGDRVLVKDQTNAADNGIYEAASGSWARAGDANTATELNSGAFTFIEEGIVNAGRGYVMTTANPITLGSTNLTWTQFSETGSTSAGTALAYSGNTLNVQVDGTSISVNGSNELRVHTNYAGQSSITTVGTVQNGSWTASIIGLAYGGTGSDLSGAANGSIFKKSGTGLVAATAGTDYLDNASTVDGGSF